MSSVSDRLTTVTYLIRRGDDVHTDNLFSQDRFRVDAVESGSKFCVLGQGLNNEKCGIFHMKLYVHVRNIVGSTASFKG